MWLESKTKEHRISPALFLVLILKTRKREWEIGRRISNLVTILHYARFAGISTDVLLTRADRQRYKIPIYNLTTGQPLPDVKGEGTLALHFDNTVFHSLFPDAELAIVRIPKPPDRASPVEVAEHRARMRELVEQGIEIGGIMLTSCREPPTSSGTFEC